MRRKFFGDDPSAQTYLTIQSSLRVRRLYFPHLRITSGGSDYWDYCIPMSNFLKVISDYEKKNTSVLCKAIESKRTLSSSTTNCSEGIQNSKNETTLHLVTDFVEKVLLSYFLRQPSQIHLFTGSKFNIFEVSCSNLDTNFVFDILAGKWPGEKCRSNCADAFSHTQLAKSEEKTKNSRHLALHADNCSGQNKNRYVFWFAA